MFAISHKLCRPASGLVSRQIIRRRVGNIYSRHQSTESGYTESVHTVQSVQRTRSISELPVKEVLAGAVACLAYSSFRIVPAGNVGVADLFGNVDDKVRIGGKHNCTGTRKFNGAQIYEAQM